MPIQECTLNGKPGFKWGATGTCYTHDGTGTGKNDAKQKAVKQAIAANGGSAPRNLSVEEQRLFAAAGALQTEDIEGVEILRAAGPVHSIGAPPEGDYWTKEHLSGMAEAARELAGQVRPANKIGHSDEQRLLRNSGLTDSELPAAGWLENIRLDDSGERLLADVKKVPAKIAKLINAGAYRTRSAELSRVTSQKTGKKWPWVVTGLAWLGGKMPSVHSLDDVVRLYEAADDSELEVEARLLASEENEDAYSPEAVRALAETAWDHAAGEISAPADTRASMPDQTYTDEQRRKFAEATGLEAEKVTDEMLAKAGISEEQPAPKLSDEDARKLADALGVEDEEIDPEKLVEVAKAKVDPEQRKLEDDEIARRLAEETKAREASEKRLEAVEEELRLEKRRDFVEGLIKDGRIEPGKREKFETLFDKDAEMARELAAELPVDESLVRELGSDEDLTEEQRQMEGYEDETARRLGVAKEAVL